MTRELVSRATSLGHEQKRATATVGTVTSVDEDTGIRFQIVEWCSCGWPRTYEQARRESWDDHASSVVNGFVDVEVDESRRVQIEVEPDVTIIDSLVERGLTDDEQLDVERWESFMSYEPGPEDDRSGGVVWLVFTFIFLAGVGVGLGLGWWLNR